MDARDNDLSPADPLLDEHRCGFTGSRAFAVMFGKYAITFDGSRIIIIDDRVGTGTGCKCNAPRVTIVPVYNAERQPVIAIRLVGSSTEYQQRAAILDKPLDARGRGAESREKVGIGWVCKAGGDDQAVERRPVERRSEQVGGDWFAADPALLNEPVEMLRCCPDEPGPAAHPLITPMGVSRATSREIPTSCTTFTTSSLGLYTSGASSAIAFSFGRPDHDALLQETGRDLLPVQFLLGLRPAHDPPCPMAGAAERLLHRGTGPAEYVGRGPHAAGDDDRLADPCKVCGEVRCIRPEGASGTFPVDTEGLRVFRLRVFFHFGNIMGHIVHERHLVVIHGKHLRKNVSGRVHDHLPVGPRIVCRCGHGPEIRLPFR